MIKSFVKNILISLLVCLSVVMVFWFLQTGKVKAVAQTVQFTTDTILNLTGLSGVYIKSGSQGDSLFVTDTTLSVDTISAGNTFGLKMLTHPTPLLEISPTEGPVSFSFSSDSFVNDSITQWTENGSVLVAHTIRVPFLNPRYYIKVNGSDIIENDGQNHNPYTPDSNGKITFTRTGSGLEIYTVSWVPVFPTASTPAYWSCAGSIGGTSASCSATVSEDINLQVDSDYCSGQAEFKWGYSDAGNNPQTKYRMQISRNPEFTEIIYDPCSADGSCLGDTNSLSLWVSTVPTDNCEPDCGRINYNVPYYWRVKVWDATTEDNPTWHYYNNGTSYTYPYAYPAPAVSFSASPQLTTLINSSLGVSVSFTDSSECRNTYGTCAFSWNFGDPGSGADNGSTEENPTHVYHSINANPGFLVTENVYNSCDSDSDCPRTGDLCIANKCPEYCSAQNHVIIRSVLNVPEWREISPF